METKMIELTATVNVALHNVARKTDDLLSQESLVTLKKHIDEKSSSPLKPTKLSEERFQKLLYQLPEGIYTTIKQVVSYVENAQKRNGIDSIAYSPFVLTYSDFKCCKTMKYQKGHIITGRNKEIEQILLTLCKSSKRGVILVGEPGVGKTAIVNAINARLIERTVPRQLLGAQVLNLDLPFVFTKFKEDPMGTIIKVLERASSYDKAILFIDEVHQLLGHKMNDVMKPYLTEQIRFIGSTTINEYHSIITDDVALERRFTVVHIDEPNVQQTINMIKGTKSVLEDEHKCSIPNDVCEYVVVNGSRFLGHRKNPDKSLDLLDIACAIMSEKELKTISTRSLETDNYLTNVDLNKKEIESTTVLSGNRVLNTEYVDLAISSVTNIPFGKIKNSLNFTQVFNSIQAEVIGQEIGIRTLANTVNIFKHVKYDRERPIAVLLMAGPPGVGKKLAAKLLAKNLYGKDESYIEYDMSGMTSEFMITELKGAPPGYIGYGKSGGLIKAIRNNPQSVLYFRGINKADNSIIQYLLNASRHGKITDSAEREAGLNNTIIIFSVTLSDDEVDKVFNGKSKAMGFTKKDENDKEGDINNDALKKIVGEDLWRSVDEIVVFNKLNETHLASIFDANIQKSLEMYNVEIDCDEVRKRVLSDSKNGHDVVSRLVSEVPKLVFKQLKQE